MIFFSSPTERLIYYRDAGTEGLTLPGRGLQLPEEVMGSRLGAWLLESSAPWKLNFFFLSLSIGKYIPLHAKWKLHFNCLFGSFSILLLLFPNYISILSVSFPLCLSRLKGWTHGSHWPLQLTWARNTKAVYLLSSLSHFSALWKASPEGMSAILYFKVTSNTKQLPEDRAPKNYLWRVHPANLSLQYAGTPSLQFMFQSHSTYAFCYLFSRQHLLKKADIKTKSHHSLPHLSLF